MPKFKVYTKSGDRGKTSLATGERVSKSDFRIECYGNIDELNSMTGFLRDKLPSIDKLSKQHSNLLWIQNLLFDIGAELACNNDQIEKIGMKRFDDKHTTHLEGLIDEISDELPVLKSFVLPGGHEASSYCHIVRTVCRRSERQLSRFAEAGSTINSNILVFINRLSDYFFSLARYILFSLGCKEIKWEKQS